MKILLIVYHFNAHLKCAFSILCALSCALQNTDTHPDAQLTQPFYYKKIYNIYNIVIGVYMVVGAKIQLAKKFLWILLRKCFFLCASVHFGG